MTRPPRESASGTPHAALSPASATSDSAVACPFCRSTETELLSLFGSQLSTAQYYCRTCHTPFEYMKQNPQPER